MEVRYEKLTNREAFDLPLVLPSSEDRQDHLRQRPPFPYLGQRQVVDLVTG